MTHTAKFKKYSKAPSAYEMKISEERIMLKLARVAVVLLLSALGFLLENHLSNIQRGMDAMNTSINKIADMEEQLAVALARVDANVRNIEKRLDNLEPRKK